MVGDVLAVLAIAIAWVMTGLDVDHEGALFETCRRRIIAWQVQRADDHVRRLTNQAVLALLDEVRRQLPRYGEDYAPWDR